jgi:hypothetical protein
MVVRGPKNLAENYRRTVSLGSDPGIGGGQTGVDPAGAGPCKDVTIQEHRAHA